LRNCIIIKRFLRLIGHDVFDDFELMILVHQASFDNKDGSKVRAAIRITAGSSCATTDFTSNHEYQQPLHIAVEQGLETIVVDLIDKNYKVLATLPLDIADVILKPENVHPETVYNMIEKKRGLKGNTKVKLTIVGDQEEDVDVEYGRLSVVNTDVQYLVQQEMRKAKGELSQDAHGQHDFSPLDVQKKACAGPLEIFERLGKTKNVYAAVIGPPVSKHWILGLWNEQKDYESHQTAIEQIDVLRIQSVQADPIRNHVFRIYFFDQWKVHQSMTFRRVDKPRDVWVECLLLLVTQVRKDRDARKDARKTMRLSSSGSSESRSPTSFRQKAR
jgi:hypothetical protein